MPAYSELRFQYQVDNHLHARAVGELTHQAQPATELTNLKDRGVTVTLS